MAEVVTPEDGMTITRDVTFAPGVYRLPNGISVMADGVTVDGGGALLIGDGFKGRGVSIVQRSGVTVKNLGVERYYHGIYARASANVRVEHCSATRTHELAAPDVFLDIWLDAADAYGAGIMFSGVIDAEIMDCDFQHQQGGAYLYGCERVTVARNNGSYCSGAGLMLYGSSMCTIEHNVADFCSRIYNYGDYERTRSYHNGADAAGLVMMNASCKNTVRHNMLRGGGDGVFLGGFHKDQFKAPCNDNVFEFNDGSWSPNIAFEATFSQRNVFRSNRADNCNYGFWLGYSSHTTVDANSIKGNRIAGVAIEHGHHNDISSNQFERNREGVQLWVGAKPAFTRFFPDCAATHETRVTKNQFKRNETAVHVWTERDAEPPSGCHSVQVVGNGIIDNRIGVLMERAHGCVVGGNDVLNNVEAGIKLVGTREVATEGNRMKT